MVRKPRCGYKLWYIADGWLPRKDKNGNPDFESHEAIMILNCNEKNAEIMMDIYYEDKDPIKNIKLEVPARRVKCFRMDHPEEIGGIKIKSLEQYALRFKSNIEVIVQYGKIDLTQPNLAYVGLMGFPGI